MGRLSDAYFDTTLAPPVDLQKYASLARSQDRAILRYFNANPNGAYTPSMILVRVFGKDTAPLTSIRRSINTLTKNNFLEKTSLQLKGPYGRPEYCWRLR